MEFTKQKMLFKYEEDRHLALLKEKMRQSNF